MQINRKIKTNSSSFRRVLGSWGGVIALALSVTATALQVHGQLLGPDEVLRQAVSAARSSGSLAAMVDFVDWDYLFEHLPSSARSSLGVGSPGALREYNRGFYSDPTAAIARRFKANGSQFAADELERLIGASVEQTKAANRRLAKADYQIGTATVEGLTARVPYTALVEGQKTDGEALMVQRNGRWLMGDFPLRVDAGAPAPKDAGGAPGAVISN